MKDKKVIFLDIDGVLNLMGTTYHSHGYDTLGTDPLEPHLLKRLSFIMERVPDSVIVISSSWRYDKAVRRLTEENWEYVDRIVDMTPRDVQPRGNQIKKFIDLHNVNTYVVLEDEPNDVCGTKCNVIPKDRVVQPDMEEGLSSKDTIKVVKLLNFDSDSVFKPTELLTSETYDIFYNLGFRPQVAGDKEELLGRWSWFEIDTKRLTMVMRGFKDEN